MAEICKKWGSETRIRLRQKRPSERFSADIEEFLPSLLANSVGIELREAAERLGDGLAGACNHGGGIAVGAPHRLFQDLVDHAESQHVLSGDLHIGRGLLGLGPV